MGHGRDVGGAILVGEFDADHQAEPAHIADGGAAAGYFVEASHRLVRQISDGRDEVVQGGDGGRRSGAGDRIAAEGGAM